MTNLPEPANGIIVSAEFTKDPNRVYISDVIENGTVSSDKETPEENDTVTLTVTPDDGYELNTLRCKKQDGTEVELTQLSGSVLAAGAFAVFFGGTIWDGLAAAVFGLGICLLQRWLDRTELNPAAMNLLISLLVGLGVGAAAKLIPGLHMDMILIGDIMLLIPGLAMTNAIRNILLGDTISGVVRLAESLLWAMALAGGIMMSLLLMEGIL